MTRPRSKILFAALIALGACSQAPDFPADDTANAPFPKLVSMSSILEQVPPENGDYGIGSLEARAADLRARAAAMRGTSVVDPATEAQMDAALAE